MLSAMATHVEEHKVVAPTEQQCEVVENFSSEVSAGRECFATH
jgi:hypothetical protein